jgi:hypothetical protein
MFIFKANGSRSGKSLLAKICLASVFGSVNLSGFKKDEELTKVLDMAAREGLRYLFFDNVRGKLQNQELEAFIASSSRTGRQIGTGSSFTASNRAFVFISGNDLTYNTDISLRSLEVNLNVPELDPLDRPEPKAPITDPTLVSPEWRGQMLSALWAIVRAWDAAGRPLEGRKRPGFEEFTQIICGLSSFVGIGDPLERLADAESGDKELNDMRTLLGSIGDDMAAAGNTESEVGFNSLIEQCLTLGLYSHIIGSGTLEDVDLSAKKRLGHKFASYAGKEIPLPNGQRVVFGSRLSRGYKLFKIELR